MEDLKKDKTSHKGRKLQKYSLEMKIEAVNYAESHGNRPASKEFHVDEKRIREWRSKKSEIEECIATKSGRQRKKLKGGGRKPFNAKLEELLLVWISESQTQGLQLSPKLIMKKAESVYLDIKGSSDTSVEDFKASRGWVTRFMERNSLILTRKSSTKTDSQSDIVKNSYPHCGLNLLVETSEDSSVRSVEEGKCYSKEEEVHAPQSQLNSPSEQETTSLEPTCTSSHVEVPSKPMQLRIPGKDSDYEGDGITSDVN